MRNTEREGGGNWDGLGEACVLARNRGLTTGRTGEVKMLLIRVTCCKNEFSRTEYFCTPLRALASIQPVTLTAPAASLHHCEAVYFVSTHVFFACLSSSLQQAFFKTVFSRFQPHSFSEVLYSMTMTMTHSEKSNICQMKAWPDKQGCRGRDPTKKNLLCC